MVHCFDRFCRNFVTANCKSDFQGTCEPVVKLNCFLVRRMRINVYIYILFRFGASARVLYPVFAQNQGHVPCEVGASPLVWKFGWH